MTPTPAAPAAQVTERQRELTQAAMRRIAELRIRALHLDCTVDEYIARTQEQTEKAVAS